MKGVVTGCVFDAGDLVGVRVEVGPTDNGAPVAGGYAVEEVGIGGGGIGEGVGKFGVEIVVVIVSFWWEYVVVVVVVVVDVDHGRI